MLALVLVVLLYAVPGESRTTTTPSFHSSSPTTVLTTPAASSTDDATLDTLLTGNQERSAYLLPLIEPVSSLLQGPKRSKERIVQIRPLHSKHGNDPVALILTSDIPVHRKPKKLHVILDSHGNRHKKKLSKKHAAKHYFFQPQSSEENYSDEGHDHSGYDTNEDFSGEINSSSKEYNEGSYSSEELGHKTKNFFQNLNFMHGFTSGENSQEENKYLKTLKHYHSVSGDSSKHSDKHQYWNKYFSGSDPGSVESPTYEISKEEIVLIEPQNAHNFIENTVSDNSDASHSTSAEYPNFKIIDTDSDHKNNEFEFSNESNSESIASNGYKDSEETVQNNQQSNQYENSNNLSGESQSYENSDEVVDHDISNNEKLISEESNEIENPVDHIFILGKEQLAENLFVQNLTSELQKSFGNPDDKLIILNDYKSTSTSEEQSSENKDVAPHSHGYSKSVEDGNNNEDISQLLNLVLGHKDAVIYGDNHHHNHYHELNGQYSSDIDTILYGTSESLSTEEYQNDDNDSKDCSDEILLPAEHTHKHHDDTESHGSQINHLISQLLEEQSSSDSSKQIIIRDLSGEDKSLEGIIEVIANHAPKHAFEKSLEDNCENETVELKSSLQKATESQHEAHKTYKLSFRFNR